MALSIPEAHQKYVAAVVSASPEERTRILAALEDAPQTILLTKLEQHVVRSADVPRALARAALGVGSSLFLTAEHTGRSKEDLASDVVTVAAELGLGGLKEGTPEVEEVLKFLVALLRHDGSIGVTAKANDVLVDHQRPLLASRILTDLRPIFSGADDLETMSSVIVHTLKLSAYNAARQEEAIYFALDEDDLRELKDVVDRALRKEAALKKKLADVAFPCIEIRD